MPSEAPHRILVPRAPRLADALVVLTGSPRDEITQILESGRHVWLREDGAWEYQHPDEGGSMLCDRGPFEDASRAWDALRDAGVVPAEVHRSPDRRFDGGVHAAECDRTGRAVCGACAPVRGDPAPRSFSLAYALACDPDGVLAAEASLGRLADALGEPRPAVVTWRLVDPSVFTILPALLARLAGEDGALGARERLVHLHGAAGLHPEWPEAIGFGARPLSRIETAALAYRDGGVGAIAPSTDARHVALRGLLETGFGVPCDLRRAAREGLLLAAQPFDAL